MIVKSLIKFGDKTTGATYAEQFKREVGDIFECSDELANERIEKGFVVKATDEETKIFVDNHTMPKEEMEELSKLGAVQMYEPTDESNISKIEDLSYSELQETAKQLNLKYVGVSKENLIKSIKESNWAVTQEDDRNVHVRPVVDGEIVDTPVEQVITNEELEKSDE